MEITQELLDKYHLNRCTPEERVAVERWLADEADTESAVPPHVDIQRLEDRGWALFTMRHPEARHSNRRPIWTIRRYIALAACLLLASSFFLYFYSRPPRDTTSQLLAYSTAPGQKATVTLPDGTRIYLNSESTLHYPEHFADSIRWISLSGEAFFEVTRDSEKPFVIETERSTTQVLGTAFNLRAYADEGTTTLVVTEGKVSFSDKRDTQQQLMLTANQLGCLDEHQQLTRQPVAPDDYTAWKDNRLVLSDRTLGDIARMLERWYGVKVSISSTELALQRYTGEFKNPSLARVLKSLAFAIRFTYQIDGHTVTITP